VPVRLGPLRTIVISHPALVEEVLVTQHRSYIKGSSHRLTRSLLGNGLLSSEGEAWRRQRRLAHLDRVQDELLAAVRETIQPARVALWLRPPERRAPSPARAAGQLPLRVERRSGCPGETPRGTACPRGRYHGA
jgi:cytochrome P450